ncbi:autotransporter domain-containing protein [Xanthobacter sp. DSM 24535]|uniref:autotransporter outer membrane beta-barrel domain-containing protein n=1 Tax=Roseixanthobacter psychrophilus TaxID=3119917 RepID=UPI00372B397B
MRTIGLLRVPIRAVAAFAALSAVGQAQAQTTSWTLYDQYTTSYFIPFAQPDHPNADSTGVQPNFTDGKTGIYISAAVNDSAPLVFQVDTGSQGMVVPQYLIPNFQQSADQQKILYSSSGNYSVGTWTTVTVRFPGSRDANGNEAFATLPVLVESASYTMVDGKEVKTDCTIQGAACTLLMGVGYGRPDSGWGPSYLPSLLNNPLLHLAGMDEGTVRAGYVITPQGIQAGLTAQNAGSGFAYVKLVADKPAGEIGPNWRTAPGTVVVDGKTVTKIDSVLMDTGISYLWSDLGEKAANNPVSCGTNGEFLCAPKGTEVAVYIGGNTNVGYSYKTGGEDNNTAAPWFSRLNTTDMVNTGIHPFAQFEYVFDAVDGYEGLKAIDPSTPGIYFEPYLSAMGHLPLPSGFTTNLPVYVRDDTDIVSSGVAALLGDITGPGALAFGGGGAVTVLGDVTLPAGVTVKEGSVYFVGNVTAPLTIAAGATVSDVGSIAGDVKNAGLLFHDGTIIGTVTNTGVLGGNGTVTGTMVNSGVLSPGHSIGQLMVSGNLTFTRESGYSAEIGASGSDLIAVGGAAVLNGATLNLIPVAGYLPMLGESFTLLTASGGITGTFTLDAPAFGTVASLHPFIAPVLDTSGTQATITLERSQVPFTAFTRTANQWAAATAADSLGSGAPLTITLASLNTAAVPAAFESLSGEVYASAQSVLQMQSAYVRDAVGARMRQGASPGFSATDAPRVVQLDGHGTALWGQGYGGWGEFSASADTASVSSSIGGFLIGMDAAVADWRLGLAAGFGQSSFNLGEQNAMGSSDNYDLAFYAGRMFATGSGGAVALRLGLAYSWHDISVDRTVVLPGLLEAYSPGYAGRSSQVFGELGYRIEGAAGAMTVTLEPFAGLAYVGLSTNGFSEGVGAAALTAAAGNFDSFDSSLGVRGALMLPPPPGMAPLALSGTIGWQHAFGDLVPTATMAFNAGSAPFTVSGAPLARDALLVGAGLSTWMGPNMELGIFYSGRLASDVSENAVKGSLTWTF